MVYVDNGRYPLGRMLMCHLLADSVDELHAFAERLGLRRAWFQPKSTPHYDICQSNRRKAISLGAVVADRRKLVELIHHYRAGELA